MNLWALSKVSFKVQFKTKDEEKSLFEAHQCVVPIFFCIIFIYICVWTCSSTTAATKQKQTRNWRCQNIIAHVLYFTMLNINSIEMFLVNKSCMFSWTRNSVMKKYCCVFIREVIELHCRASYFSFWEAGSLKSSVTSGLWFVSKPPL